MHARAQRWVALASFEKVVARECPNQPTTIVKNLPIVYRFQERRGPFLRLNIMNVFRAPIYLVAIMLILNADKSSHELAEVWTKVIQLTCKWSLLPLPSRTGQQTWGEEESREGAPMATVNLVIMVGGAAATSGTNGISGTRKTKGTMAGSRKPRQVHL
jgi:hypothetical protein